MAEKITNVSSRRIDILLDRDEPSHDKTNKMACALSEDSYQPEHPPSLIRDFAGA